MPSKCKKINIFIIFDFMIYIWIKTPVYMRDKVEREMNSVRKRRR